MRLGSAMLLIAAMMFAAPEAFTHPLPDSTIFLDVGREQVEAELRLPAAQRSERTSSCTSCSRTGSSSTSADWKLRAVSAEPFVLGRITYRTRALAVDLFEGSE